MDTIDRYCTDCGDERTFVRPFDDACPDGHGDGCPEWACAECGAAVLIPDGPVLGAPAGRVTRVA